MTAQKQKNKTPLLTVILPTYNIERYLRQCLDSVVNQTYKNLEIIILDDNSSDSTPDIIKEYAANDDRIKPVFHTKNHGPGNTRNEALEMATGDYVTGMDHDDWQDLTKYEKMMEKAAEHDVDIVFCMSEEYVTHKNRCYVIDKLRKPFRDEKPYRLDTWEKKLTVLRGFYPPWAKIVRTDLVRRHNVEFSEGGNKSDDVLFHYHSILVAENVCYVNEVLYTHRFFPQSISGQYREKGHKMVQDRFHTWQDLEKICKDLSLPRKKLFVLILRDITKYAYKTDTPKTYIDEAVRKLNELDMTKKDFPTGTKKFYLMAVKYSYLRQKFTLECMQLKKQIKLLKGRPLHLNQNEK